MSAASLRTAACEERSARWVLTVPPGAALALTRASATLVRDWALPTIATSAPRAARASAAARPMPLVAPVIRTWRPLRANSSMDRHCECYIVLHLTRAADCGCG